ncbi:MAG: LacI family transcriptional regulator [Bacteroidales bacterium]|nr:LacI family transcriptional regulator [Bacteroidales bacterium]MCL2133489.1 LacI family transcriptional regulator [Bacteroidales bacterium]
MKNNRVTIYDIAKELKISASTVSRALADHSIISTEVKHLVIDMARQMGYRKNSIALSLKKGKANTIGVIIPRIDRNFFSKTISAIESEATKAGYNVLICQSNEEVRLEKVALDMLCNGAVEGLLVAVAAEKNNYEHLRKVESSGIPIVYFDRYLPDARYKVMIDDYIGAKMATEHLLSLGLRKIVHFSGYLHVHIWNERLRGYLDAMKDYKITVPKEWIFESVLREEKGLEIAKQMWQKKDLPEAIFSASDYSALGALSFFKMKGLHIPQDIAITGFANEPFTSYIDPPMTTIEQHPADIGKAAVRLFIKIQEGYREPCAKLIRSSLIVRQSSMI